MHVCTYIHSLSRGGLQLETKDLGNRKWRTQVQFTNHESGIGVHLAPHITLAVLS
jgi:hypothetical protein